MWVWQPLPRAHSGLLTPPVVVVVVVGVTLSDDQSPGPPAVVGCHEGGQESIPERWCDVSQFWTGRAQTRCQSQ